MSFWKLLLLIFMFFLLVEEVCVFRVFLLVVWNSFCDLFLCWLFEFKFFLIFDFLLVFFDLVKVLFCFVVLVVKELIFLLDNFGVFLLFKCFSSDVGGFCLLFVKVVWEDFWIDKFWGVNWIRFLLRIELGLLVWGVKMVVVLLYLFFKNLLYFWINFILIGLIEGFFFCFLRIFL